MGGWQSGGLSPCRRPGAPWSTLQPSILPSVLRLRRPGCRRSDGGGAVGTSPSAISLTKAPGEASQQTIHGAKEPAGVGGPLGNDFVAHGIDDGQ